MKVRNPFQIISLVALYLRTIRYLSYEQGVYRIFNFVKRRYYKIVVPINYKIPVSPVWNELKTSTSFLSYPWFKAREISSGRFRFLNKNADYGNKIDWEARSEERLWRYNLHYFQYIHPVDGLEPDIALHLIHDWISNNSPGSPDAWDPYPISLRIVNWIKYINHLRISENKYGLLFKSLYEQTRWLEKNLEMHLLGNHLFKNAKALVFAGLFFEGSDADRWLKKGLLILEHELKEQILPDGGHIERSPMYHSMITEDCLDLLNICKNHTGKDIEDLAVNLKNISFKMVCFLRGMIHPDGEVALFNDTALGIEAAPYALFEYYTRLTGEEVPEPNQPILSYPDTGYYIMAPRFGDRMIIDCGAIGPDYQPGHAHCDTLSFELSIANHRIIVDSGCCTYDNGEMRNYNRSNDGHNVLTLNGENQSEIWASHRCARRARPLRPKIWSDDNGLHFEGGHDGYYRLSGKPQVLRHIQWKRNEIIIEDKVIGSGNYDITSRLHINPECDVKIEQNVVRVLFEDQIVAVIKPLNSALSLIEGWYCPTFGQQIDCQVIMLNDRESAPFKVGWILVT